MSEFLNGSVEASSDSMDTALSALTGAEEGGEGGGEGGSSYLRLIDEAAIVHTAHVLHQEVQGGSRLPCDVQSDHVTSLQDSLGHLWGQSPVGIS